MPEQDLINELIEAVSAGNTDHISQNLSQISDINLCYTGTNKNLAGMHLIHITAAKGNLSLLDLLVEKYWIDPNTPVEATGMQALHYAAGEGKTELVNYLLWRNANPHSKAKITDNLYLNPIELAEKNIVEKSALTDNEINDYEQTLQVLDECYRHLNRFDEFEHMISFTSNLTLAKAHLFYRSKEPNYAAAAARYKIYLHQKLSNSLISNSYYGEVFCQAAQEYLKCLFKLELYALAVDSLHHILTAIGNNLTQHSLDFLTPAIIYTTEITRIISNKNITSLQHEPLVLKKIDDVFKIIMKINEYLKEVKNDPEAEYRIIPLYLRYLVLTGFANLADQYYKNGQYTEAEIYYSQALKAKNYLLALDKNLTTIAPDEIEPLLWLQENSFPLGLDEDNKGLKLLINLCINYSKLPKHNYKLQIAKELLAEFNNSNPNNTKNIYDELGQKIHTEEQKQAYSMQSVLFKAAKRENYVDLTLTSHIPICRNN